MGVAWKGDWMVADGGLGVWVFLTTEDTERAPTEKTL